MICQWKIDEILLLRPSTHWRMSDVGYSLKWQGLTMSLSCGATSSDSTLPCRWSNINTCNSKYSRTSSLPPLIYSWSLTLGDVSSCMMQPLMLMWLMLQVATSDAVTYMYDVPGTWLVTPSETWENPSVLSLLCHCDAASVFAAPKWSVRIMAIITLNYIKEIKN